MKFSHRGELKTDVHVIIPYMLYVSKSTISNLTRQTREGVVYALHLTPFITVGLNS